MDTSKIINVLILGDPQVGKSTFIQALGFQLLNGSLPESPSNPQQKIFETTIGNITVNGIKIKGSVRAAGEMKHISMENIQAVIIMFEVTNQDTYNSLQQWYDAVKPKDENKQLIFVLLGNKVDQKNREVKAKQITFHRKNNAQYFDISAQSKYNILKPFIYIFRRFFENGELEVKETFEEKTDQ